MDYDLIKSQEKSSSNYQKLCGNEENLFLSTRFMDPEITEMSLLKWYLKRVVVGHSWARHPLSMAMATDPSDFQKFFAEVYSVWLQYQQKKYGKQRDGLHHKKNIIRIKPPGIMYQGQRFYAYLSSNLKW